MQSKHETLGEIIKNARIKAVITIEDLTAKVGQPAQRVKKSRCPWEILTGSSALRLCVWLFDDNDM